MKLIEIKKLNKFYSQKPVLKDIDLTINDGDRIGIVGPNGNGKTTLCEIIAGLRPHDSGTIEIEPDLVFGMQLQENPFPTKLTTWDFCKFYIKSYCLTLNEQHLEESLKMLGLADIMLVPVNELSGGQKQRVNILLATIHHPDIMILDELASGLDINSREMIYRYINRISKKVKAMILVSHELEEIERNCNKILVLINGTILYLSTIQEVINKHGSITEFVKKRFTNYYAEKDHYFNTNTAFSKSVLPWKKELSRLNNANHSTQRRED